MPAILFHGAGLPQVFRLFLPTKSKSRATYFLQALHPNVDPLRSREEAQKGT
ncbi:hypothetical protein ACQV5M_21830 [Leptospira sp. SA-E8]|uniref:hypothetical protein n=1 Tax=Leptospira sp. SA-E8 TaxID=3422259 RepID=UPI003EBAE600